MLQHGARRIALLLTAALTGHAAGQQPAPLAYRNPSLTIETRVRDLLGRMTLEEKFWQLYMTPGDLDDPANDYSHGAFGLQIGTRDTTRRNAARAHAERINSIQRYFVERTRLGVPIIPFEEAVHGLTRAGATMFPSAIALAATWDSVLAGRVFSAIARETRSRGIRDVLSPVINIADDVRWGRVEETYGEDPHLSSVMGRAFVSAFERAGIVTTPKHFVANVGAGGRDSYPIELSERKLEELHFPPFKAALAAGARSVMTAYNSVDGSPATQSRWLLTDKLKRDWQFKGFVISDAAATGGATVLHFTEASTATATHHAFNSGLDVVFQSTWAQHRPYLDAFRRGLIADSVIDSAVTRVLRVKLELGLFEKPFVNVDSAAFWNGHADHRALALEAARAGLVLLRNENATLPFAKSVRTVALIGGDAVEARLGGYSGPGVQPINILSAMQGKTSVRYARGPGRSTRETAIVPATQLNTIVDGQPTSGLRGEYFANNRLGGPPTLVRTDAQVNFGWTLNSPGRGIPFDWYSVRWTGQLTAAAGGVRRIGVEGNDGFRLWLDDKLIIDNWKKQSYSTVLREVNLESGKSYNLRLEYFESTGNARIKLLWDAGMHDDWRAQIDSAVQAARASDVAVVVAGVEEGEFRDRARLALPGQQEELIQAVAATGKPTVVVLIGGSAITMSPWLERVGAVIDAWYPGEQGGQAVVDALFGEANPSGRLPITFPIEEGQLPLTYNHKPTGRGDDYVDLTGQPLFPFGFGLSYTTFEYRDLIIAPLDASANDTATIRGKVKNTGKIAGAEVVQLYVRDLLASVARPVLELKGFQCIHLAPGEEREVTFRLPMSELRMLDENLHWVLEPGAFRILLGSSSKDIRLRGQLTVR